MQIFKNVKGCKDPKKDFDGQSIQLRDIKMEEFWLITINVEELEFQKHFQNIKAVCCILSEQSHHKIHGKLSNIF